MTPPTNTPPRSPEAAKEYAQAHSEHYQNRQISFHPPQMPGSGPPCIWDNAPTQKAGSCYVCVVCGESTSCG